MAFGLSSFLESSDLFTSDHASVVSMNLFVALLCACIVLGHLLEENRWVNESITALIIVKKKQFFVNFMTIMLFGAIGTLISCSIISFAIGAIFAATDSVCTLQVLSQDETPLLYSLVFGEGVVNDATSVVLFNAIQSFDMTSFDPKIGLHFIGNFFYLFISSTFLGVAIGLLCAYVIKKLYFGRHSTDREVALMMLMSYLSYIMAELFYLSGILTVFFCGIVMSHYTWHNVTESSRVTTRHSFATLSFVAETFIFLYVGMDALDIDKWTFVKNSPGTSVAVSSILVGLILVGRAAFVFPLSFLSNLAKKNSSDKISFRQQFTTSGHTSLHENAIMITSTVTAVLFSTVVFGLMTQPLINLLLPPHKQLSSGHSSMTTSEPNSPKHFAVPLLDNQPDSESDPIAGPEVARPTALRMLLRTPTHTVHRYWRKFDDSFMRPVFGGRGFVPFVAGSPAEQSPR
nr:sodium/hydrogen exchanger 1-like isoform X1 [Ipomoea batatas]